MAHESESASSGSQQCTLFSDDAATPPPKVKKPRVLYPRQGKERSSLEVEVTVGGEPHKLRLLRPLAANENIFALYEPASMWLFVQYIRECGFDDHVKPRSQPDPALPKGIRRRGNRYLTVYTKEDGSKGYKQSSNLEAALVFQANPAVEEADNAEEGEPEDAEAEGDTSPSASPEPSTGQPPEDVPVVCSELPAN